MVFLGGGSPSQVLATNKYTPVRPLRCIIWKYGNRVLRETQEDFQGSAAPSGYRSPCRVQCMALEAHRSIRSYWYIPSGRWRIYIYIYIYSISCCGFLLRAQVWTVLHVSCTWHKTASIPNEIMSNRVCRIWLGIGEGANVLISK